MKQIYHDIFNTLLTLRIRTENGKKGSFLNQCIFMEENREHHNVELTLPKVEKQMHREKQTRGRE